MFLEPVGKSDATVGGAGLLNQALIEEFETDAAVKVATVGRSV